MARTASTIRALGGARFTVDRGLLVVGGTGTLTIPVPTHLIEHPRGMVLVDTGPAPEAVSDPEGVPGSCVLTPSAARMLDARIRGDGAAIERETDRQQAAIDTGRLDPAASVVTTYSGGPVASGAVPGGAGG